MSHNLSKFILKSFLIILIILPIKIFAQNVGVIDSLDGEVYFIDENSDKKILAEELDDIDLNKKYFLNNSTKLVFSLLDGTTLNFEKGLSFQVLEYEDILSPNPHYVISFEGGLFMVETGELPKINKNSSKIITNLGQLVLNGTAISADFTQDRPQIFLMTDSFGEEGELLIETKEGTINVEPNSGVSVSTDGVMETKAIDEEILNKQQEFKNIIVESSIVDADKIEAMIEKKISSGTLKDLDGDGVIGDKDKSILIESITKQKNAKVDTIIQNTKNDPALLGEIVKKSSDQNSGALIEKMIEKKPEMISKVAENILGDSPEKFSKILASKPELSTKVIDTIVKSSNENDNSLSMIVAKADTSIAEKLLENISENKKELLTKIVAESAEISPTNLANITKDNEELSNKLTTAITENILESLDSTEDLKLLILQGNEALTSKIIEDVEKVDVNITSIAINESLNENKEKLVEKLSNSLESNNILSKKIISESIKSGQTDIIIAASQQAEQKINKSTTNTPLINITNQSNNNTPSNNSNNTTTNTSLVNSSKQSNNNLEADNKKKLILENLSKSITEETNKIVKDSPEKKIEINNNIFKELNKNLASPS